MFGVRPMDPVTFAAVVVMLLGVSLAACYLPALARHADRPDDARCARSDDRAIGIGIGGSEIAT